MQLPITSHRKLVKVIKNRVDERKEVDEEFERELRGYLESTKTAELPDLFPHPDKEVKLAKKEAEDQRKVSLEPAVGDTRSAPDAPDTYDDNGCQRRGEGAAAAGPKLADISSNAVAHPPLPLPPPLPAEEERKRQEDEASKRERGEAAHLATSTAAAAGEDGADAAPALGRKRKKKDGDATGQDISHLRAGSLVSSEPAFPFSLPCGCLCLIFVRFL
jgi:hypothetical protein